MYTCSEDCLDDCYDCRIDCCDDECCENNRIRMYKPSWSPMMYMNTMRYRVAARDRALFMYDRRLGRYAPGETVLRNRITDDMRLDWTPAAASAVMKWAADNAPELWEAPPLDRLNVLNGILDISSGKLEPHTPDFLSPVQINAAWQPGVECPHIDRFVQKVFPDDAGELFYQLAGLYALPDTRCQKAVMLLGSGSNGKSLALALLQEFLGHHNVAYVPLHELSENPFGTAELQDKLLNVASDLPDRPLGDTSVFKRVVDGRLSAVHARRRYGKPFSFRPFARLIFSANRVPDSADASLGYLRRWIVVPFDAQLTDDDRDPFLLEKLTAPEELSGLLNHAVSAYRHLLNHGRLIESPSMQTAKDHFTNLSDPTRIFLNECVQTDDDSHILRTDLYRAYKKWCAFHRTKPVSAHRLYTTLRETLGIETNMSHGRRIFRGVRLLPEDDESE